MNRSARRPWGAVLLLLVGIVAGFGLGAVTRSQGVSAPPAADAPAIEAKVSFAQATADFYIDDNPIIRVVDKVKDAVVNIEAESSPRGSSRRSDPGWFPFFHPPVGPTQSLGSGFFIRPDGTILTNAHVVADASRVTVRLSDEHETRARVLGIDRETDLAVLKIETSRPVPFIELGNSDSLRIGQWVVAIGNPFPRQRLDRTVTVGVVSGVGRSALNFGSETPRYQSYIQTDAAINPGNSGGPLVDLHGRAVGVNAAIASPSGGNVGIGFAIPVSYVRAVLDDLVQEGQVSRGYLGISPAEVTPDIAESLELGNRRGIMVQSVQPETAASRYGIKQGDIIVRFNGEPVTDVQQFMFLVARVKPNTTVDIEILRDAKLRTLAVMLGDRKDMRLADAMPESSAEGSPDHWFGMRVTTATPDLADRYSVGYEPGVMVIEVEAGSVADARGIARGNIITQVQRQPVTSVRDFRRLKAEFEHRERAVLFLVRGNDGQPRFVALKNR